MQYHDLALNMNIWFCPRILHLFTVTLHNIALHYRTTPLVYHRDLDTDQEDEKWMLESEENGEPDPKIRAHMSKIWASRKYWTDQKLYELIMEKRENTGKGPVHFEVSLQLLQFVHSAPA